ncbi:hypothetical protein C8J43_11515 [Sphingomonas sp. PP-CE-1G-424]|nr:hypothetical protein C8J43_11515 [Sphingomonas sp. PP-CE-1G-424]
MRAYGYSDRDPLKTLPPLGGGRLRIADKQPN